MLIFYVNCQFTMEQECLEQIYCHVVKNLGLGNHEKPSLAKIPSSCTWLSALLLIDFIEGFSVCNILIFVRFPKIIV